MVYLVLGLKPPQDRNGGLYGGFLDLYRLESPFESSILANGLPVLVR